MITETDEAPVSHLEVDRTFVALVLAGTRPEGDPVADFFGASCKAMAPLHGQPMIQHVLNALGASNAVRRVVLIGNGADDLAPLVEEARRQHPALPFDLIGAAGTISESVEAAIESYGTGSPYLVTTGDNPLLTPGIIHEFTQAAGRQPGICVGFVDREIIQRAHPDTVRTYLKFRDTAVSGANLFSLRGAEVPKALEFWRGLEQDRKKTWKLFRAFGLGNLAGLLVRRFSLDEAFLRAGRVIGCATRAVRLSVAEAAMDVDRVQDYFLAQRILESRERRENLSDRAGTFHSASGIAERFAVFDLDRTITRQPTFTKFLLSTRRGFAARAALMLRILPQMIRYKRRGIDRLTLKNRMLLQTFRGWSRSEIEDAARRFFPRFIEEGMRDGFYPVFNRHRAYGDTLVLATASIDIYARFFASHFGFHHLVCTPTAFGVWGDQRIAVAGKNCYGPEKLTRVVETLLPATGGTREDIYVTAYSDDLVDAPLLEWADTPIVVCPDPKTERLAQERGMKIVVW